MKKLFIAVAMLIATPGLLQAQDFFFSFSDTAIVDEMDFAAGSTGTAFLFSGPTLDFDNIDLLIQSSDDSNVQLTAINEPLDAMGVALGLFDNFVGVVNSPKEIRFAGFTFMGDAVSPGDGVPGVGSLLTEVGFDVLGPGQVSLDAIINPNSIIGVQDNVNGRLFSTPPRIGEALPVFAAATINPVPEPASAMLLLLGSVGLVARRKIRA